MQKLNEESEIKFMQAVLTNVESQHLNETKSVSIIRKRVGLLASVFGCWHHRLTRPITATNGESYRACLHCGAHRRFNPETLESSGTFYFPANTNEQKYKVC